MTGGARILAAAAALALAGCDPGSATAPAGPDGGGVPLTSADAQGPPIVPAGKSFDCTPRKVWDGDGPIHCAEGARIRLAGIAAREMDGSCKPGHPCPDASAPAARDMLARLLGRTTGIASTGHLLVEGPALRCRSDGSAGGSRTAAWCTSPTAGDLSCAMVASGTAAKWERYWRGHRCGAPGRP